VVSLTEHLLLFWLSAIYLKFQWIITWNDYLKIIPSHKDHILYFLLHDLSLYVLYLDSPFGDNF
jgi:hypothetical protein